VKRQRVVVKDPDGWNARRWRWGSEQADLDEQVQLSEVGRETLELDADQVLGAGRFG